MNFIALKPTKVIFDKEYRKQIWNKTLDHSNQSKFILIGKYVPALKHQIIKSYNSNKNIQSAIFSECVYAQTYANMLNLNIFINCFDTNHGYSTKTFIDLIKEYFPNNCRYIYTNKEYSKALIQSGSPNGIDAAIITFNKNSVDKIYSIEFKEPYAKLTEPDLPNYKNNGDIYIDYSWIQQYPHFKPMLEEHKNLNFFKEMGHNINDFSLKSIEIAIQQNYTSQKKFADIIITEDNKGYLTMIKANDIEEWADIEGEIRPAGRNHYNVWTVDALKQFLIEKNAKFENNYVCLNKNKLEVRRARGGGGSISGYKINPLFFIKINDCIIDDQIVKFDINSVRQLKPTITAKMSFKKKLSYFQVKVFYFLN